MFTTPASPFRRLNSARARFFFKRRAGAAERLVGALSDGTSDDDGTASPGPGRGLPDGTRDRELRRQAFPGGDSTALFRAVYRETDDLASRCAHLARRPCPFTIASSAIFFLAPLPHSSRSETRCHVVTEARLAGRPPGGGTSRPRANRRTSAAQSPRKLQYCRVALTTTAGGSQRPALNHARSIFRIPLTSHDRDRNFGKMPREFLTVPPLLQHCRGNLFLSLQ